MDFQLKLINLGKNFIFHHHQGTCLTVLNRFSNVFYPGEAAVLSGPSGAGKSTLLRMIYAGYKTQTGNILVRHQGRTVDMASARPDQIYEIRRHTIGYVSQFLRVVPRVTALDTVIEPLTARGMDEARARSRGQEMLKRLNIPQDLWYLSASTFSGGEQQRINIARGFIAPFPILLLDEPTASLDAANRSVVMELIREALDRGTCILVIFHDEKDRDALSGRIVRMERVA